MPSDPHSDAYNTGLWLKRINVRLKKSPVTNGFLIWRKKNTRAKFYKNDIQITNGYCKYFVMDRTLSSLCVCLVQTC